MFEQPKVGIVGIGFVGNAIRLAMQDACNLVLIDSDPKRNQNRFEELFDCEAIFVCVPSPQGDDGRCDTSIMEGVLEKLEKFTGVIISKCTASPEVYTQLNERYNNLVHAPEFLVAATANQDYVNGTFAFIGGKIKAYRDQAAQIIKLGQLNLTTIHHCTIAEAAMAKYTINTFLATKVIWMNEMYQLCEKMNIDFKMVMAMATTDQRIGSSHTRVPGTDGQFGFGGACFPKDTAALLKIAEDYGVPLNVLDAAVKKNTLLRLTEPK